MNPLIECFEVFNPAEKVVLGIVIVSTVIFNIFLIVKDFVKSKNNSEDE